MIGDEEDKSVALDNLELRSDGYYNDQGNLRPKAVHTKLGNNHFFHYRPASNHATEFWFYSFACGPATDATGKVVEGERVELVFYGWATDIDGVRHLYFANDGYVFYPWSSGLLEALQFLHDLCPEPA